MHVWVWTSSLRGSTRLSILARSTDGAYPTGPLRDFKQHTNMLWIMVLLHLRPILHNIHLQHLLVTYGHLHSPFLNHTMLVRLNGMLKMMLNYYVGKFLPKASWQ